MDRQNEGSGTGNTKSPFLPSKPVKKRPRILESDQSSLAAARPPIQAEASLPPSILPADDERATAQSVGGIPASNSTPAASVALYAHYTERQPPPKTQEITNDVGRSDAEYPHHYYSHPPYQRRHENATRFGEDPGRHGSLSHDSRQNHGESQSHQFSDGIRPSQEDSDYFEQRLREEVERRLNAAAAPESSFTTGTRTAFPFSGQSAMGRHQSNFAPSASDSLLPQGRSSMNEIQRSEGQLPASHSARTPRYLVSQRATPSNELMMFERSRGAQAQGGGLPGSQLESVAAAAAVRSSSHPLPSIRFHSPHEGLSSSGQQHRNSLSHVNANVASRSHAPRVPPCLEGRLPLWSDRAIVPLSNDQDRVHLPEMLVFARAQLVEVFRASGEDVAYRIHNKPIIYQQIGIRCKFCAHLPRNERVRRAATFPKSIGRMRHSVVMMIREHFGNCQAIPKRIKATFNKLKAEQSQGSDGIDGSRKHWAGAASTLGLVDTPRGIMFQGNIQPHEPSSGLMLRHQTQQPHVGFESSSSSSMASTPGTVETRRDFLVEDQDRPLVPDYLYFVMSQAIRISVSEFDQLNEQQQGTLPLHTPGFGCSFCCRVAGASKGVNRFFPARSRFLPAKVQLLYRHLQHCQHCPREVKESLSFLKTYADQQEKSNTDEENEKAFFARVWTRLHGRIPTGVPVECHERMKSVR